ncbi:MAG: bifunctional 4-hydroxy-2-oxoglutarate aldolase/2-dehydro-3-deoxy-phosphogluconate aldolase [Planctomycetota bacterium]
MDASQTTAALIETGVVAVVRASNPDDLPQAVEALAAGGVTAIEITLTVPGALRVIEAVAKRALPNVLVGAGSVLDAESAKRVIDAGATFVVSPVVAPDVIATAKEHGAAVSAGALTPTEAWRAASLGAGLVKVFPADAAGMPYLKSILAPMPHLKLMPTGGVTLDNAGDWLRAGASAVGVGSALVSQALLDQHDWPALTARAQQVRHSVDQARAEFKAAQA